jgi:hypothetical protein
MTSFEEFYDELVILAKTYEKNNVPLRIEKDLDNDIIKIFGEKITALSRAKNGLNDTTELAYATAEHHPYWNLLYNSSEISNIILEKWKDKINTKDIEDIEWALQEINQTLKKIKEKNNSKI